MIILIFMHWTTPAYLQDKQVYHFMRIRFSKEPLEAAILGEVCPLCMVCIMNVIVKALLDKINKYTAPKIVSLENKNIGELGNLPDIQCKSNNQDYVIDVAFSKPIGY